MWNARLNEAQAGIKIARRNITNVIYGDDTILMAESEEELKGLLKLKEESEKADLKLDIQKTKIMASGPLTSWQIDEEKMETVTDFIFLGPQITVDTDCSHDIKKQLSWKLFVFEYFWFMRFYQLHFHMPLWLKTTVDHSLTSL